MFSSTADKIYSHTNILKDHEGGPNSWRNCGKVLKNFYMKNEEMVLASASIDTGLEKTGFDILKKKNEKSLVDKDSDTKVLWHSVFW